MEFDETLLYLCLLWGENLGNNAKIRRQQVFEFYYLQSKEDQSYFDGENFCQVPKV